MTFDTMWDTVERKNKQLETGTVKMSSANFKRAMRFAYDAGASSGASSFGDLGGLFNCFNK